MRAASLQEREAREVQGREVTGDQVQQAGPVSTVTVGMAETERDLGITYRQLDHWARKGYLRPVNGFGGSGRDREWPAAELEIARRMGRLVAAGLSVEKSAAFARDTWPHGEIAPGISIEAAP